ncbi:hypothetical protein JQ557_26860 [Bradyrhizobium sp. U87765 SZCCT0131]|uniref:hypothetical protein n=1 Tax=unclassified Bradyrhizobium TaxID=2631580 RepID=UPI001BA813D0|nr:MULTISPECIES: hypothetical protein [unclassified Bradyrhizobium]MBR1221650.1 hypothetical protein [Bradyrhizobium sp. U87765 SZCCT0131]MBR1264427.1 hypothetical protein [Bradyrhizobium sp. U87765 SZCCT0134]MBR1304666.1 hypothetical protein [Bradyrhizobium sp. U87765 SZCCT0110]MBR1322477.1 hypothetical protein [Bradyrhizobium sp. U87765 SZCCT0109]MBR1346595.1 hypothetical protein [Bradyrhizobium sp. U87765 SZCCT0048]
MSSSIDAAAKKPRRGLRTIAWGAAALVVLAVVAGVICKLRVDELVARARAGGVKLGAVELAWPGHVHLRDVSLPLEGGRSIDVGTVVLRPRVFSYGGGVHGENVRIDGRRMTWTIPQIDIEGANLDATTLRSMLTGDARTPADRVAQFEADRIVMPSVLFAQTVKLGKQNVVYRDVTVEKLAQGRAAIVRAGGAQYDMVADMPGKTKSPGNISASMGAMTAQDVGIADTVRLYTEVAKPGEDSVLRLHGAFSVKDIREQIEDGVVTMTEARGDGFRVRLQSRPLLDIINELSATDAPESLPAAERQAYVHRALSVLDMIVDGNMEFRDVHVAVVARQPGRDMTVYGDIDSVGVAFGDRKADLRVGRMAFSGGPSDKFSVGEFEVKGFSWAPTVAALEKGQAAGRETSSPSSPSALMPELGHWRVADVVVDLPKGGAGAGANRNGGGNTTGPRLKFALKSGELRMLRPVNGIPSSFRSAVTDLMIDPAGAQSPAFDVLRELGYGQVAASFALDVDWHEAEQTLAIDEVSLSARDVGGIRMTGSLGGVKRELFTDDPVQAERATRTLTGRAVSLRVEDSGLFDRLLKLRSEKAGVTVEETRASLIRMAQDVLRDLVHDADKARDLDAAISGFITRPGALLVSVKAKQEAGLSLADIEAAEQDPDGFLAKIDMSVTRQ